MASSPGSNLRFSSMSIEPFPMDEAASSAFVPMTSSTKVTFSPVSSDRRSLTGLRLSSGTRFPPGRSRCEQTMGMPPFSRM